MTIHTDTSRYLTNELRTLTKAEGLEGPTVTKRVAQLRKQGYVVVANKSPKRTHAWRVYELDR